MRPPARRKGTIDDFWAIPEGERFHEFRAMEREIVEKAEPTGEHGSAQVGVVSAVAPPFQRKPGGGGGPGGWWIQTEVEILLETGDVVRPDVVGWRREHCPERPTGAPIKQRPDWVCEIVSASNASEDKVKKLRLYHRNAVPYYWLVDPREATLTVMRFSADDYVTLLTAGRGEVVRAEPFHAIELNTGTLFGDDPPDP